MPTSHFRSARSPTPIAPRLSSAQMSQAITSIKRSGYNVRGCESQ